MKSFFASLDLYKVIIILSLVLLPAVGGWAFYLQGELEDGRKALRNALRERGGDLEEIGKYQKAVEEQKRGALDRANNADNPNVYFDACIRSSDRDGQLQRTDFSITKITEQNIRKKAVDVLYGIEFKRDGKRMALPRDFLLAVLFNCESSSQVWKLRELTLKNDAMTRSSSRNKPPPPELEDKWVVQRMIFASRRPLAGAN